MIRKDISKTKSGMSLANRKLFLKILSLSSLSNTEKVETIILQVSRVVSSIF